MIYLWVIYFLDFYLILAAHNVGKKKEMAEIVLQLENKYVDRIKILIVKHFDTSTPEAIEVEKSLANKTKQISKKNNSGKKPSSRGCTIWKIALVAAAIFLVGCAGYHYNLESLKDGRKKNTQGCRGICPRDFTR